MTVDRIHEPEDRSTESIQYEKNKNIDWKKMNGASGIYETDM